MSVENCHRVYRRKGFVSFFKSLLQNRKLGDLLISSGRLTRDELQYALAHQKASVHAPLGRILVQQRLVSRRALYRTLARQRALRCVAAILTFMISLSGGMQSVRAGTIEDVPSQISLVSTANSAFAPMDRYPALFGSEEKASSNIAPFVKWSGMFRRFQADLKKPQYQEVVRDWENSLRSMKGLPLPAMAQRVNDLMNARPYTEDKNNWGASDYWETPLEFLTRSGDCEDYAIAKYASLRMLGVPEDRMRLAIVKDLQKGVAHALLIVYTGDGDALVLDNQNKQARAASRVARYKPIYSINRNDWWLHKTPSETVLASAQ